MNAKYTPDIISRISPTVIKLFTLMIAPMIIKNSADIVRVSKSIVLLFSGYRVHISYFVPFDSPYWKATSE